MSQQEKPIAITAADVPLRARPSIYPEPFASRYISLRGGQRSSQMIAARSFCPAMCAGFKAGTGNAHCLINETGEEAVYLEIGDRTAAGDEANYPDDDLKAMHVEGQWKFVHKDGTPYA